ncbi:MAG: radical SAM protein [Spirochaetia bacterium]
MSAVDLKWIDSYFSVIRKFLFIRPDDNVMILPPNRVIRLNETAAFLLNHMNSGGSVMDFPEITGGERGRDVGLFFSNLRALYENSLDNPDEALAVETVPYDFHFTELPVLGEIAVTYRCNNRCRFCYAGCGQQESEKNGEMTLNQIKKIIRIFKDEAKIPFFSFTGGEPLLRTDLEKMISYAEGRDLRTNLVTNGTLADKGRAKSLYKAGLRTAQVSIEADTADLHDYLTGISGSFSDTVNGIKALQDAGISVQTNTTITRPNAGSVKTMPAFLSKLGINRFAMNLFIPTPEVNGNAEELFLPYEQTGSLVEAAGDEARKNGLTFYWYSPTPHCFYNPIAKGRGNKSCAAMDGLLSVSPRGDVLPCSSYSMPMGNLLRTPFRDVWFSKEAAYFKNKEFAPPECKACGSFTACQGACPLYWDYAGKDILKKEVAE